MICSAFYMHFTTYHTGRLLINDFNVSAIPIHIIRVYCFLIPFTVENRFSVLSTELAIFDINSIPNGLENCLLI